MPARILALLAVLFICLGTALNAKMDTILIKIEQLVYKNVILGTVLYV